MRRLRGPTADDVRDIDRAIVIGRADADVEIHDPEVSRRHAVIRPVAEGVEVEDLGSSNGTFVDGQRISGKLTITQNATLRVGETELSVEIELPQVTRIRQAGIPPPEATVLRPALRPDVTAVRPQPPPPGPPPERPPGPPPGRPPGPPAGPPPGPPAGRPAGPPQPPPPAATSAGGRPRDRRLVAFGAGGVVLGAVLAVAVILLLGGSSTNKTASTGASHCAARFPPVIHDGFPEPQMRSSTHGVLDTSLHLAPAPITVGAHRYTTGMEYDHQLPGPTLVVCPSDRVTVHLFNGLPLPTNLHVHGLHVSPVGEGDNVFIDVKPLSEQTYQYQIPLDQSPGFYWYHPHYHPWVQPEEAGGAAGAIVVQGSLDDRLPNIPQRLIVIQGGNRGHPRGASGPPSSAAAGGPPAAVHVPPPVGFPELLVNGVQNPMLPIHPGQIQRWRILNATSDRMFHLVMPGASLGLIAQDGVTLRFMRPQRDLLISPGSRVEVLVRGGPAGVYPLTALPFHQCHKGCNPFAGPTTGVITPKEDLLTMVSSGTPANDQFPSGPIGSPPDLRQQPVDVRRTILLTSDPVAQARPTYRLDQRLFDPNRVDITMKLGSVEEWTLKNPANGPAFEWHSFHIHQNAFQVISVNGRRSNYVDWQDNVTLAPGDTVVIRMHPIDFTGKFVFHCHVIFHEDNGMMGTVQVVAKPTAAQVNANRVLYLTPPTNRALYADLHTTGSALSSFILYCRHLLTQS